MKKIFILLSVITMMITSCHNGENDFPDFDYTTGYFPYQYPVRILVLGNYVYDNSNDNNHKFIISTAMGGVYENRLNRTFTFKLEESLCKDAFFPNGDAINLLPTSYYKLSSPDKITIPSGKFNGGVEVQLSEAFFNDPQAIKNTYVLPLKLTGVTDIDSLLNGYTMRLDADPRVSSHWTVAPKDFTMFAVKFVNPFHGMYLHCGKSQIDDAAGVKEDSIYSEKFIESNELWNLSTSSRAGVSLSGVFKSSLIKGSFNLNLKFASDKYNTEGGVACTVEADENAPYTVSGTGKYMIGAEEFGNKKRDAIYLSYTIDNGTYTYNATDTLVFRDKNVSMEVYSPKVVY